MTIEDSNTNTNSSSSTTVEKSTLSTSILPPLHFTIHWLKPILYLLFLLICNVAIPCLLYYLLLTYTSLSEQGAIGIASASLGISSCFDSPFRLYRLVRYRKKFGPLLDDVWWHFDFFMWTYTIALFFFAIPLAIAPAIPLYDFFLFSTAMLVAPIGVILFISLYSFSNLPFWLSSDPPGTKSKPAVYYILEDVVAVDFEHDRKWRGELQNRYAASLPFRTLMYQLTIYWTIAAIVYVAITSAVTWGAPLHFAFGWVLGQFFLWALVAGVGCYLLTRTGLKRERIWWEKNCESQL